MFPGIVTKLLGFYTHCFISFRCTNIHHSQEAGSAFQCLLKAQVGYEDAQEHLQWKGRGAHNCAVLTRLVTLLVLAMRTRKAGAVASSSNSSTLVYNPGGSRRVVVTRPLAGDRWVKILTQIAGCRVEVLNPTEEIVSNAEIAKLIGSNCDGAIGLLTEQWDASLLDALHTAGGTALSNYAVGYDNVCVEEATKRSIAIGNTPGVAAETIAELAASLTLAAARRLPEVEKYMRAGRFKGWVPTLFLGKFLKNKTVGVVGAGSIGTAYAKMMVEGHKMHVVYYDIYQNTELESFVQAYGGLLEERGERRVMCRRASSMEDLAESADVVSLHCNLNESTKHIINADILKRMKPTATLVNTSRGKCIDEKSLVRHLNTNASFTAALDVFEEEPRMAAGLDKCDNAIVVPHIASASYWARSGMATLAAANVAMHMLQKPARNTLDVLPYIQNPIEQIPQAMPSIVNASELGIPVESNA